MGRRKRFFGMALLAVGLLPAVTALADADAPEKAAGADPMSGLALIAALLALAVAVVLYLAMRRAVQAGRESASALSRRVKELDAALGRLKSGETAKAGLGQEIARLEQELQDLRREVDLLQSMQQAAPRSAAPTPPPAYPRPAPAAYAPPPRPATAPRAPRAPEAADEIARFNRVLDGSDSPERAMQKVFTPGEIARMELLHYVRPQMKLQDASYAQFCAYDRINPSNVSLIKAGSYVVPSKLSLNAPAIADWYEVSRLSDKENAAPHMVILTPAQARECPETVINESHESKKRVAVEKKGKLVAYNL